MIAHNSEGLLKINLHYLKNKIETGKVCTTLKRLEWTNDIKNV